MKKIILEFLKEHNLNLENQKIVVAVSTGLDSMVLLNALQQLQTSLKITIIVVHVNHGLRQQSKQEEVFLKQYCSKNHLTFYSQSFSKDDFSNENFHHEARNLRLKFFFAIMEQEKSQYLFLAHHLNDSIETSFMHILRGSNLKGYLGIEGVVAFFDKWIIRPFINVLKGELKKYADTFNIEYFEDSSNAENIYTRNRIRHYLVPPFFNEDKNFSSKYLDFKDTIAQAWQIVSQQVEKFILNKVHQKDGYQFNSDDFLALSCFLQKEVLFTLLKKYNFSKVNILEIIKYINSSKANLMIEYKKIIFIKEYKLITIKDLAINSYQPINLTIDGLGTYDLNDGRKIVVSLIGADEKEEKNLTNLATIWYNSSMLPLKIRTRLAGDQIVLPFGLKKVKDLLIDKKIEITKRKQLLLLVDQTEVLAIFNVVKGKKITQLLDTDLKIELKEKK